MSLKKMKIIDAYDGSEHWSTGMFIGHCGHHPATVMKIKKCFMQDKILVYYNDGVIQKVNLGKHSTITYMPRKRSK